MVAYFDPPVLKVLNLGGRSFLTSNFFVNKNSQGRKLSAKKLFVQQLLYGHQIPTLMLVAILKVPKVCFINNRTIVVYGYVLIWFDF